MAVCCYIAEIFYNLFPLANFSAPAEALHLMTFTGICVSSKKVVNKLYMFGWTTGFFLVPGASVVVFFFIVKGSYVLGPMLPIDVLRVK